MKGFHVDKFCLDDLLQYHKDEMKKKGKKKDKDKDKGKSKGKKNKDKKKSSKGSSRDKLIKSVVKEQQHKQKAAMVRTVEGPAVTIRIG